MVNRDPKQCAKAVQGFWNNERDLIKQGQGTRNWSVQEQIEIMNFKPTGSERKNAAAPTYGQGELGEYGMNYDKYEGQHMKSAETYPDFQGDPNNIQALTRGEHQQAHGGDFRNPTNGYYDPETGEMSDFGNNPPENIKTQQLNEVYVESAEYQYILDSMDDQQDAELEQDTSNESVNEDALSAYESKQAEMQNPTDGNTQDVLNDFEQNKAEMENPTGDNFQEPLDNYDQMKADMQSNDIQQDNSPNQLKGESGGMDSGDGGIDSGGGIDSSDGGIDSGGGMDFGGGMDMGGGGGMDM